MAAGVGTTAEIAFILDRYPLFPGHPLVVYKESGILESSVVGLFKGVIYDIGRVLSLTQSKATFKGDVHRFDSQSISKTITALKNLTEKRNLLAIRENQLEEDRRLFPNSPVLGHEETVIAETKASISRDEQAFKKAQQDTGIDITLEQL